MSRRKSIFTAILYTNVEPGNRAYIKKLAKAEFNGSISAATNYTIAAAQDDKASMGRTMKQVARPVVAKKAPKPKAKPKKKAYSAKRSSSVVTSFTLKQMQKVAAKAGYTLVPLVAQAPVGLKAVENSAESHVA